MFASDVETGNWMLVVSGFDHVLLAFELLSLQKSVPNYSKLTWVNLVGNKMYKCNVLNEGEKVE